MNREKLHALAAFVILLLLLLVSNLTYRQGDTKEYNTDAPTKTEQVEANTQH